MIPTLVRLAVAGTLSVVGFGQSDVDVDEQARLADAVSASSLRLLEAGFSSAGPGDQSGGFVSACLGGVDAPGRLAPLPGEIARYVSDVHVFQPDSDGRPDIGELITVAVVTVADDNDDALDWFVLLLGSADTAGCRRDEFLAAREADPASADIDATVSADPTADLSVGDASARLDVTILFSRLGFEQPVSSSYLVSRIDRTLVVLRSARFGTGPFSVIDPAVELSAIVQSLGGP